MKVLIVEDDMDIRGIFQEYLSPYGECVNALNGEEAFEGFLMALEDGDPYDLILLDIMMPRMDGHAVLEKIRLVEKANKIPITKRAKIIMVSGLSDPTNIETALDQYCDAYLIKPIDRKKFMNLLVDLELLDKA